MTARVSAARLAACLVAAFMLSACGGSGSSSPAPAPRPEPKAPAPEQPAPEVEAEAEAEADDELAADDEDVEERTPEYVYSPIGKRDPFRSPFTDLTPIGDERRREERLTVLQRWDLDQLTLRAVITATADPVGMVLDPDGLGHFVRRGTLIGKNWGRVTAIRRECIVVTEQMRDATGTPMAVQQERCLPKDDRERRFEEQMRQSLQ
jgi:type IV pilus assembly protein PilP